MCACARVAKHFTAPGAVSEWLGIEFIVTNAAPQMVHGVSKARLKEELLAARQLLTSNTGAISIVDVAFFYCVVRAHIMSIKATIGGWISNYFEQCKKEPRPLEGLTIICDYAQVMPNPHHSVIARALDMKRHVNDHHIIRGHVSAEAIFYIGRTKVQRKMPFSYPMSYFCPSL